MIKKIMNYGLILLFAIQLYNCGCDTVNQGEVGLKIHRLGDEKGGIELLRTPGLYFTPMFVHIETMPTNIKPYVWTAGKDDDSPTDESITVQSKESMGIQMDVGITMKIDPGKADSIYREYRMSLDQIIHTHIRNAVRDSLVRLASGYEAADINGGGKVKLFNDVKVEVTAKFQPKGIIIEDLYLLKKPILPATIQAAIDNKMVEKQNAEAMEAKERGAKAEARANVSKSSSISRSLLRDKELEIEKMKITSGYQDFKQVKTLVINGKSGASTPVIIGRDDD